MADDGFLPKIYQRFLEARTRAKGYDFQHSPCASAVPPVVSFSSQLRWWTLDRWKRMKSIRDERDRRVQEILDIKRRPSSTT
jgi:hypothetical protein